MFRTVPVYALNLEQLRRGGRFASPEGEGEGKKADDGKPADPPKDGKPAEGEKKEEKPADTGGRISALVEERNAAQRLADEQKATAERLQRELEQLKANDQTKVVADLQKRIADAESATKTRFDKLLELELANLPEAAQRAVKAIPGGSEAQFDWLVANRVILQPSGEGARDEKKGVDGPKNEKKPDKGNEGGASSVAKGYVESRKPKAAGFPGLTG